LKSPSFQWYAADFYMDTVTWDMDDIGCYVSLLNAEWINGPLPNDVKKLAKICRKTERKFIKNWSKISHKFVPEKNENIINLRLEFEREKQKDYREKQSLKGKKRAYEMWKDHIAAAITTAKPSLLPEDSLSSSSSSSSSINLDNSIILDSHSNSAVKTPRFDFEIQEILKMYHKILPGCPAVKENGTIPKSLRRRIAEKTARQELIWWKEYFQYVSLSDFLTGKKTDFVADLEWLIGPKNMQKVLNGRYHRDHKNGCSGLDEWVRINEERFAREDAENGKTK